MFVSEVLRIHPIGNGAIRRYAVEDTVIQGIGIEKGTAVHADIYSIHFDRELWGPEDPYVFFPERHKTKRHPMAYLPFGAGPRHCIGMRARQGLDDNATLHEIATLRPDGTFTGVNSDEDINLYSDNPEDLGYTDLNGVWRCA
ncbi:unnamed protein product, partial [Didymodactylos carnosus]